MTIPPIGKTMNFPVVSLPPFRSSYMLGMTKFQRKAVVPDRPPILPSEQSTDLLFEGKIVTVIGLYQSSFQRTDQCQPYYLTGHVDGAIVHVNCKDFFIENLIGESVLARITRVFSSQYGGTRYEAIALQRSITNRTPY